MRMFIINGIWIFKQSIILRHLKIKYKSNNLGWKEYNIVGLILN